MELAWTLQGHKTRVIKTPEKRNVGSRFQVQLEEDGLEATAQDRYGMV